MRMLHPLIVDPCFVAAASSFVGRWGHTTRQQRKRSYEALPKPVSSAYVALAMGTKKRIFFKRLNLINKTV